MNILFIASDNNNASGAFLSMVKLNSMLNTYSDVNTSIILPCKGTGEDLLKKEHLQYHTIRSFPWIVPVEKQNSISTKMKIFVKNFLNIPAIIRLMFVIKKQNVDIVHVNTSYSYVGAVAGKVTGTPVIWHLREFLEEDQNNKIANRKKGYALINYSKRIVAISNSIYKKYFKIFDKDKLVCIYNGIDKKKFYVSNKTIFQNENINLIIVGGLYKKKGQLELCKACKIILDKGIQNFHLQIVGDGDEEQKLKEYIKENQLDSCSTLLGKQSNVEKLYRSADIAFMCSKAEAFGRVTVEAMLSGCLVIGANTAATEELIEHNATGLLYQQGSAEDLAEKIEYAITHKDEMRKIAAAGRKFAVQNMTAEKNAENIYALYKEVLNENK